ncbi:MAG: hypothetical protein AAF598_17240, partial [Bacteroidota bacterium]
ITNLSMGQTAVDSLSNLRIKVFETISDTLVLDSFSVVPSSLVIKDRASGEYLEDNFFRLADHLLICRIATDLPKGIEVQYRIFPFRLSAPFARKDTSWIGIKDLSNYIIPYEYNPYEAEPSLFEFEGLNYSGSFARGISFGNNQDLVLNSSFNLQLAGNIGDDIEILAALSDNNIPLQPEGNTQQLQEFDQIYIQLKRKNAQLIAGDYQLRKPTGYFLNYFRRLQGGTFSTRIPVNERFGLKTRISGAISRGEFSRNTFLGEEGNQGPYKLRGNNGERFIIIIAGTERVYIDGILMVRGSENDYVINYNTGELTFTTNQLITKDKRIVVEFTYSTNNYPRSLYGTNLEFGDERLQVYFNYISQQDGKNQSSGQTLTAFQREQFETLGDAAATTLFSGVDTLETFDIDRPMYFLTDSTVNSITYDSVFVQTFEESLARYQVTFSNVGVGNGNYIRQDGDANFRIFVWVAPDSLGNPRGEFAPLVQLVPPERQQMMTLGVQYQINDQSSILTEVALSNNDVNTFSSLDADNNIGLAFKTRYETVLIDPEKREKEKGLLLKTAVDYEFVHQNFRRFEPFRNIEFRRDWNVDNSGLANEHLAKASLQTGIGKDFKAQYELGAFLRDSLYTGFRHFGTVRYQNAGFEVFGEGNLLLAEAPTENSSFFRPKVQISKTFEKQKNWSIGTYFEREKNARRSPSSDTLFANSFWYDLFRAYIKGPEWQGLGFNIQYQHRLDYIPDNTDFRLLTTADELNLNGNWKASRSSNLTWNLTYRNLQINKPEATDLEAQETYLGRVEYSLNVKKGLVRGTTSYEIGAGQEQKIEFNYLEVNPGEGTFSWLDRNNDGIKQIDEFEIAVFQDQADHIRVTTFTDEFIRSNNVRFNQSLALNPSRVWRKKKGVLKFISRFSTQSAIQINRRTVEAGSVQVWNPFQLNLPDTALLSVTASFRNSIFFNRINPKYSIETGNLDNRNRVFLSSGFESRRRQEYFVKPRWNVSKQFGINLESRIGTNE